MANFPIPENPEFSSGLRMLETTDQCKADVFNALYQKLITNDAFLKALANTMIEKSMISHVMDSVDAEQVLGADVGPKITELTSSLQEQITQLNSDLIGYPDIEFGTTNSATEGTVHFGSKFKSPPAVVATSAGGHTCGVTIVLFSTANLFNWKAYLNERTPISTTVSWIAIGIK